MKKISLAILCLLLSYTCEAQLLSGVNPTKKIKALPQLYAGVKLGANFTNWTAKRFDNQWHTNLLGGLYAGITGLGFGVQFEGIFEQSDVVTGSNFYDVYNQYYNNIGDSLSKGVFRVNKLCLPIIIQFRVARLIWVQGGIQFYGVVGVKDYNNLVKDAKTLFKVGNRSALLGSTLKLGDAQVGLRLVYDFESLNNLNSKDPWRQVMLQAHLGLRLF